MILEEPLLEANLRQNYLSNFKIRNGFHPKGLTGSLYLLLTFIPVLGHAADLPQQSSHGAYDLLEKKAQKISSENHANGWASIISGGCIFIGSIPAYYLSQDVFAKVIYTVGETVGIAAVGYGSYLVLIENEYSQFQRILQAAPRLSNEDRVQLAERFFEVSAERARNVRRIRVITHALAGGLNFLDAFTSSNQDLKITHLFLGGINALAALSFGISKSEEEKFSGSIVQKKKEISMDFIIGPVAGIRIQF